MPDMSVSMGLCILCVALWITSIPGVGAQPVLKVDFPESISNELEQGQEAMSAEDLVGQLLETGQLVNDGEEVLEAAFGMMIVGPRAQPFDQESSGPIRLDPGRHPIGEHLSGNAFVALLERHYEDRAFRPVGSALPNTEFSDISLENDQVALVLTLVPHAGMATAESRPVALVLEVH